MCCDLFLALALSLSGSPDLAPTARPAPRPPAAPVAPAARPAAEAGAKENVTAFDAAGANLDWSERGWKLVAGGAALKDFGRRESDAREALRLIRALQLNQRGVIGGPSPAMEYWLSDGRPPQAPPAGMRVQPMDAPSLRVERTSGQWVLRDDRRVLFNFGASEGDARDALAVVHKYGFTHVGLVDPASPAMMVFFAEPGGASPLVTAAPATPHLPEPSRPAAPPVVDPSSPAGRLLAKHPEIMGGPVVAPAIPPLRQAAVGASPQSAATASPDRTPFDYRQVQLRQDHGNWKLAAGGFELADFGGDEHAARLGQAAVQYYRFTERRQVGAGPARFTYLLANGQPPRGAMFGVDGKPFQMDRLEVRKIDDGWAVCAGDEPLVKAGDDQDEARQVLDVIRKMRCDRLCRLGGDGRGMTFLVRTR